MTTTPTIEELAERLNDTERQLNIKVQQLQYCHRKIEALEQIVVGFAKDYLENSDIA